jgi:hypothetical protein
MAKLSYLTNMSLDGYIEDRHGVFDFGRMDDDLFATYTDLLRTIGTFLYGRRLYEMMAAWETTPELAARSPLASDFADPHGRCDGRAPRVPRGLTAAPRAA